MYALAAVSFRYLYVGMAYWRAVRNVMMEMKTHGTTALVRTAQVALYSPFRKKPDPQIAECR